MRNGDLDTGVFSQDMMDFGSVIIPDNIFFEMNGVLWLPVVHPLAAPMLTESVTWHGMSLSGVHRFDVSTLSPILNP